MITASQLNHGHIFYAHGILGHALAKSLANDNMQFEDSKQLNQVVLLVHARDDSPLTWAKCYATLYRK